MSSIILPQAQRLIFCRAYAPDPQAHEVSLRGLFHRLKFSSFPTPFVPFTVYAILGDALGEGEMKVTIYECQEDGLSILYERARWFHFLGEPDTIEFEMPLHKLKFFNSVMHLVALTFDGQVVAKRFLPVEQAT